MNKQTEALKLALEALNRGESQLRWEAIAAIEEVLAQPENGEKCHDCGGMGYQDGIGDRCPTCNGFGQQPEQEPVMGTKTWFEDGKVVTQHLTAKDIYKEPEQEPVVCCGDYATCMMPCTPRGRWLAEQEPVAYPEGDVVGPCVCGSWPGGKCLKCPRITTPAQPEQEPVATVTNETGNPDVTMSWWHEPALPVGTKLYTTPPKREWIELTDEDLEFWTKELGQGELGRGVLRAVADHLKEKNT